MKGVVNRYSIWVLNFLHSNYSIELYESKATTDDHFLFYILFTHQTVSVSSMLAAAPRLS